MMDKASNAIVSLEQILTAREQRMKTAAGVAISV